MKNVLIIGAHYDDAELGAGATAALLIKEGKTVYKLTLTDNVTNYISRNIIVEYETSKEASKKACEILGIQEITSFKPIECSQLKYNTETMQEIENIINELNIDTVFIHFNHDMNQDHIAASKLCTTAARHCENILLFKSNGYLLEEPFSPTVFFDVSSTIELKKKALEKYGSEHNRFGRLFQNNIDQNRIWGYGCNCDYAEGFVPIKYIERF